MAKNRDLQIIIISIILLDILALIEPLRITFLRILLGIPIILFIPGYTMLAALFPRKNELDTIERFALSFGLSIAIVPLLGFGLNFTPFGIRLIPILFSLSIFIFIMCILVYYRRLKLREDDIFSLPFSEIKSSMKMDILESKPKMEKTLILILIISLLLSIITLIFVTFYPSQGEKYTEFYILGENGKAWDYPVNLELGKASSVKVGIVSHEYNPVDYTIRIVLENETLTTLPVRLEHNSTWENSVTFVPDKEGNDEKLSFLLFKDENFAAPYRDLHLWIKKISMATGIPLSTNTGEVLPSTNISGDIVDGNSAILNVTNGSELTIKLDIRKGFFSFDQKSISGNLIEVNVGDTVLFFNDGAVPVTLVSEIPDFGTRLIDVNKRISFTFTKPGTNYIYLDNNKDLNVTIIAKPP